MIAQLPVEQLETSPLYRAWTAGGGEVESLLGGFAATGSRWASALERPVDGGDATTRSALTDALAAYNRDIGASSDILERLTDAGRGGARFVVTGQQPGPFGGPLMTVYKVATAVALARRLEEAYGRPVVPLYWMGADDIDFAEIREFIVAASDLTPVAAGIAQSSYRTAAPVGSVPAAALADLWKAVAPLLGSLPGYERVQGIVAGALDASNDHGDATARILMRLFGGDIAVVDGRSGEVRRHARSLILSYFDGEEAVRELVTSRGAALEAAGYHAQISIGPDSGVFLLRDGTRQKISPQRRDEVRAHIGKHVEDASPGVILRTLVQDAVFDPVAVVLGPAEVAYRAQLADLYAHFGLNRPIAFPRFSATWVAPAAARIVDDVGAGAELVVSDPARVTEMAGASRIDPALVEASSAFRRGFEELRASFLAAAGAAPQRSAARLGKRIADVERRLEQALDGVAETGREAALERWPGLAHFTDVFVRRGAPQERYLAAISPWLHTPDTAAGAIAKASDMFVEHALDGRVTHIVYSS